MRLLEVERKARSVGIKDTWKYSKKDLIKAIQRTEGFADCFAIGRRNCDQFVCCWRIDCIK
jgi:hypothetical protein